eukprot:TRINITY_DN5638_c0_g1_i1.p1 TRINITY_DN5638_c0_g1~~TRINITY_DN5638_c0_g1_i1.p1  ORF type:complete len:1015 (-),score=207.58 TRINITY_DN5638_c0_g1_i1:197-3241(-)
MGLLDDTVPLHRGLTTYQCDPNLPLLGPVIREGVLWHCEPVESNGFRKVHLTLRSTGISLRLGGADSPSLSMSWSPFAMVQACRLASVGADERLPQVRLFRVSIFHHGLTQLFAVEGNDADAQRSRWVADLACSIRALTQSLLPSFQFRIEPLKGALWTRTRLLAGYMLMCDSAGVKLVYTELHCHHDDAAAIVVYEDECCDSRLLHVSMGLGTTVSERVGVDCSCFIVDGNHFSARSAVEKMTWLRAISNVKVKLRHTTGNPSTEELQVYRDSIGQKLKELLPPVAYEKRANPMLPILKHEQSSASKAIDASKSLASKQVLSSLRPQAPKSITNEEEPVLMLAPTWSAPLPPDMFGEPLEQGQPKAAPSLVASPSAFDALTYPMPMPTSRSAPALPWAAEPAQAAGGGGVRLAAPAVGQVLQASQARPDFGFLTNVRDDLPSLQASEVPHLQSSPRPFVQADMAKTEDGTNMRQLLIDSRLAAKVISAPLGRQRDENQGVDGRVDLPDPPTSPPTSTVCEDTGGTGSRIDWVPPTPAKDTEKARQAEEAVPQQRFGSMGPSSHTAPKTSKPFDMATRNATAAKGRPNATVASMATDITGDNWFDSVSLPRTLDAPVPTLPTLSRAFNIPSPPLWQARLQQSQEPPTSLSSSTSSSAKVSLGGTSSESSSKPQALDDLRLDMRLAMPQLKGHESPQPSATMQIARQASTDFFARRREEPQEPLSPLSSRSFGSRSAGEKDLPKRPAKTLWKPEGHSQEALSHSRRHPEPPQPPALAEDAVPLATQLPFGYEGQGSPRPLGCTGCPPEALVAQPMTSATLRTGLLQGKQEENGNSPGQVSSTSFQRLKAAEARARLPLRPTPPSAGSPVSMNSPPMEEMQEGDVAGPPASQYHRPCLSADGDIATHGLAAELLGLGATGPGLSARSGQPSASAPLMVPAEAVMPSCPVPLRNASPTQQPISAAEFLLPPDSFGGEKASGFELGRAQVELPAKVALQTKRGLPVNIGKVLAWCRKD